MNILFPLIFIFVASFLFAKIEIAIEGAHGWAENFPTWKLPKDHWISKLFFGGRPATGYHTWINLFMLFFFHIVYLFQLPSFPVELKLISLLVLFWVLEDFLWFVLNPAYGISNFKKDKIWWHQEGWWWIAPREYFIFVPISVILWDLSTFIK
jgi:hypothetical protein